MHLKKLGSKICGHSTYLIPVSMLVLQIDGFIFCRNFNFTNKTYELVKLDSINQLAHQICKIEAAESRAGVSNDIVGIPYPMYHIFKAPKMCPRPN